MTIANDLPAVDAPAPTRRQRLVALAGQHPYLVVGTVALSVRVALALATFWRSGYLIPDEQQYVELARVVASGHPASDWSPTYGQFLYSTTWPYTGVLRFLFVVFGQSRLVAQLYPAVVGAAVAVLTTALARRFVSKPFAMIAGLLVALTPSQVLWSGVALREAFVWFGAVSIAYLCALAVDRPPKWLVPIGVGLALSLTWLHDLRNQTMLAAIWALILAGWWGARHRVSRGAAITAIAIVFPVVLGVGLGGISYLQYGMRGLAERRTDLAIGADSAVTDLHLVGGPEVTSTTTTLEPSTTTTLPVHGPGGGGGGGATTTTTTTATTPTAVTLPSGQKVVGTKGGPTYIVDDSPRQTLSHLPRGFLAFVFRPYPWESTEKLGVTLARVENLLWFALYALALAGLVLERRNGAVAFPVLFVFFIVGIASVSQGNVGTAFRHRGQFFWVLAVFSVIPLERWWLRRRTA